MTVDAACLIALLAGGLPPALALAAVRRPEERLVGLLIASSVTVFALMLFSQVSPGQPYELVLPLVLAPLSFAGTLVFTRLLARRDG